MVSFWSWIPSVAIRDTANRSVLLAASRAHIELLILDASLCVVDVAGLFLAEPGTVRQTTTRASPARRATTLSAEQKAHLQHYLTSIRLALLRGVLVERKTLFNVLVFPGPEDSEEHVKRLLSMLSDASISIDLSMYVVTHEHLTLGLLATHARGISIRVATDHTQMHCKGSKFIDLVKSGIEVLSTTARCIHHDKFLVVDKTIFAQGSANWSEHAMISSGLVTVHDDKRATVLVEHAFEKTARLYRHVAADELRGATLCLQCARHATAHDSDPDECVAVESTHASELGFCLCRAQFAYRHKPNNVPSVSFADLSLAPALPRRLGVLCGLQYFVVHINKSFDNSSSRSHGQTCCAKSQNVVLLFRRQF